MDKKDPKVFTTSTPHGKDDFFNRYMENRPRRGSVWTFNELDQTTKLSSDDGFHTIFSGVPTKEQRSMMEKRIDHMREGRDRSRSSGVASLDSRYKIDAGKFDWDALEKENFRAPWSEYCAHPGIVASPAVTSGVGTFMPREESPYAFIPPGEVVATTTVEAMPGAVTIGGWSGATIDASKLVASSVTTDKLMTGAITAATTVAADTVTISREKYEQMQKALAQLGVSTGSAADAMRGFNPTGIFIDESGSVTAKGKPNPEPQKERGNDWGSW